MSLAGNKCNQKLRYALLAGTMLPAVAIPQTGMALGTLSIPAVESAIVLAQAPTAPTAVDPKTGKPLPKGTQPPAKGPPPKGPQTGQPPGAATGAPTGAQPKQIVQPPQPTGAPTGTQQKQIVQPPQPTGAPTGTQQKQIVQPPQPTGAPTGTQQKQIVQPPQPTGAPTGTQQKQIVQPPQPTGAPTGTQQKQIVQPPQPTGTPTGTQQKQIVQPPQPTGTQQKQIVQPPQPTTPPTGAPQQQVVQPPQQTTPPTGAPQQQVVQPPQQTTPPTGVAPVSPQQQFGGRPPGPQGMQQGTTVDQLRSQRRERTEAGGRLVIEEPGRRVIVREGNTTIIRYDDNERFRRWGAPRFEQRGGEHYAYIVRPGGYQIINVTDSHGRLLRRVRRGPDGREIILIDNRVGPGVGTAVGVGLAAGVILGLAAPVVTIPRERYIVNVSAAPAPLLYETLEAPPLVAIERPYSLDEIRYNVALRDRMRRVDIDSITFDSGSWEVTPEQQPRLAAVADAIRQVLARNPSEMFLIEGHTDAVGAEVDNLSLSDRRAEAVAVVLTDAYQIPPENLVTQGYGEQHLKIPTDGPVRENRRVTARRVTPLLNGGVASR